LSSAFRLPAEWEPQSGVLITWPHRHSDWVELLERIEPFFIELSRAILQHEKLLIIAYDEKHQESITDIFHSNKLDVSKAIIFCAKTNDTWTRDYGPIVIRNETNDLNILNFTFNAWGNKFPSEKDNKITEILFNQMVLNANSIDTLDFVLEGGSIDSDGSGILLTTEQCLLNKNRNPDLSKAQVEKVLREKLNTKKILWLSEGLILGDDTDSHIDMLARFTDSNTIVYASCADKNDDHYHPLLKMKKQLEKLTDIDGQTYKLHALPIPSPILDQDGLRLPASYANFLIINNAVLLPVYDDSNDEVAENVLKSCFPDREIIKIDARSAITQGGSLHCLTMQLISGVLN